MIKTSQGLDFSDILSPYMSQLTRDFPENLQKPLTDWLEAQVTELWATTSDIPKQDIRLKSLSLMLARRLDRARKLSVILEKHEQGENISLFMDLLSGQI